MIDNQDNIRTVMIQDEDNRSEESRPRIIDSPKIEITILNNKFIALLDTGATTSVCSESLYNRMKNMGGKIIELPTCGLFCSTAIGRKKQRIKIQSIIPVQIGHTIKEIIFLIIPNLAVELIIGCDSFSNWKAIIDFGRNNLRLCDQNRIETITFVNEENIRVNDLTTQENMLEETFFVESIT